MDRQQIFDILIESSLCHLAFSHAGECEKEVRELTKIVERLLLEERIDELRRYCTEYENAMKKAFRMKNLTHELSKLKE